MAELSDQEMLRYNRQIILRGFDFDGQEALKDSRVLVVGLGGLGCAASQYLASAGVGNLTLLDFDTVSLSNLQRQTLHSDATVGQPKVESARYALTRINPHIAITPVNALLDDAELAALIAEHDLVLDCTDNVAVRNQLNAGCFAAKVPLVSGEIAEDITNYFAISEQTPTVCALGVLVNPDLTVQCAGGFIVQLMPGATEDEITRLEKNIGAMPGITTLLQQGKSIPDILNMALDGFNPELLDSTRIDYCCDCSLDRVERTIRSLGKKEVEKLRDEDPIAEVNCQFCGKQYKVDLNDLLKNWPDTVEKQ